MKRPFAYAPATLGSVIRAEIIRAIVRSKDYPNSDNASALRDQPEAPTDALFCLDDHVLMSLD